MRMQCGGLGMPLIFSKLYRIYLVSEKLDALIDKGQKQSRCKGNLQRSGGLLEAASSQHTKRGLYLIIWVSFSA